jgi:hypothetical protein
LTLCPLQPPNWHKFREQRHSERSEESLLSNVVAERKGIPPPFGSLRGAEDSSG